MKKGKYGYWGFVGVGRKREREEIFGLNEEDWSYNLGNGNKYNSRVRKIYGKLAVNPG